MARPKIKINWVKVQKKINREMPKSRRTLVKVSKLAEKQLRVAKRELISEFNNHPITKEIEAGPDANNTSGTLGGYGNLFSYIGFYEEEDPIELVRLLLNEYELKKPKVVIRKSNIQYKFRVIGMTKKRLFAATRLSWLGKSWLQGIESGISGIGKYLHDSADYLHGNSRSSTGIQSSQRIRGGAYRPTQYISALLNSFEKKLR